MKTVDPYYEWLGIPPKDQPPNHYRLLGLELFEENRSVIDTAANRQMSFIKQYQTGVDSELSQKLLNELSAARLCLLSPSAKAAYDERLRSQVGTQEASAPAMPVPPVFRWQNEPTALPEESASPGPLASAIPLPVATALDSRPASATSPAAPVVTERLSGVLPRSTAGLGALAVATGLVATAVVIVLSFVLASPRGSESTSPVDTVAQRPGEPPANTEIEAENPRSKPFVAEKGTASEPPTFSPPPELAPEGARTGEPVDSGLPPMAVPATPTVTQTVPPRSPVIVVERIEPVPVPAQQPDVGPAIVPSAECPKTTVPPPPSVETLEQADQRLQAAAGQASSSAEHQAVAQELLSLADKAILDSQIELAKQVVGRALAAARKSESDDLVKQITLLWSELEQPLTDEVKENALRRLGERKP